MSELAAGGPAARDALTRLFKVYGKLFERRLRRMGMEDQAEDIAQALWLEVSRAALRYRGEMPVRIFLLGFLKMSRRRYFSDLARRPPPHGLPTGGPDPEPEPAAISSSKSGPEWLDFERCVRRALARFEVRYPGMSRLLLLRHVEELSLEEMVEELGGSTDRAKAEVFAARRKMSPLIKPCLELWPDRGRSRR